MRGRVLICGGGRSGERKNVFAGAGEMALFAENVFDGDRIGLQRFHAVFQLLIFLVEFVDFRTNFRGLFLRTAHGQHAVSAENILKNQKGEAGKKKPIQVAAKKNLELFGETFRRGTFRVSFRLSLNHREIQARASSASCCDAAGDAASV